MRRSRPRLPASSSMARSSASDRLPSKLRTVTPGAAGTLCSLVQNFALVRGGNLQFFPVLRDRAAREDEAFALEDADDLRVAQGLARVFVLDDLPDALLDRDGRDALAVRAADAAVEEVLHLEHALRGVHVLVRHDATDGGLVHADVVGDVAQHQRPQVLDAVVEEIALEVDDAVGDLLD